MAVSLPEDFIQSITPEDVEKVLTDPDWEDRVAEASLLAVTHCSHNPTESDFILKEVINYNVTKRIRELYLERANPLPKEIKWDNTMDNTKAYELLEYIILQYCMTKEILKEDKPHTLTLFVDNELIEVRLNNWCLQLEELYNNAYNHPIKIIFKKTKVKNKYIIKIQ